ncbi:hypothetical protein DSL64_18320 [Dyadobacter luteus]|uniref:Sialate O-acetylesterase domain-containing protein n=1 Tax=Dyadobacter luteus TaxID=2259619 RepID=A0A3D8Y7Y3_9BACT|nr:T9SS type A sorting domain-containing protein [Dyadobacter luteus]REA59282.1 hypothetical protein DSL64_18320 [Dyadobacter luteus]
MIRHILLLCLILLATSGIQSFGQKFNLASFDKLPSDKQLFPRDKNNEAAITISGRLESPGFTHISVVRYRNEAKTGYQKASASYTNGVAQFKFDTKIKSELAEYAFEIYAIKSATDSSLIVKRSDIVAGDFYIIYGQSNAVAWEVDYQYRNEYCRSFGASGGEGGFLWGLSNSVTPRVGIFGIEFQRLVAEKYGIPTCVINGAVAGASLADLTVRNNSNPTDGSNPYGSMLSYATQSGLLPYTRAIYYWQGENEAASPDPLSWAPRFPALVNQLQQDYPSVEKIYVFQLPLFGGGAYDDRIGVFRESQRTLDRTLPIVQPYAALGAPGWNGFHYGLDGYLKLGQEMADMAGYFHYGKKEKMTSPSLQKAFYSNPQSSEITMVFEDYQEMVYPNDTITVNIEGSQEPYSNYSVKDFFFLNGEWQKLKSGRAEANKIIVDLKNVGNDTTIKYLPSKYHFAGLLSAPWVYIGPFLRNTKGFRAFAFHHNKIHPYTDLGALTLNASEDKSNIVLKWNTLPSATSYMLERVSGIGALRAHEVIHLKAGQTEYSDPSAKQGVEYTYSIRGISATSESKIISTTIVKQNEDTPTPVATSLSVFPNPAIQENVNIVSSTYKILRVDIFTTSGQKVKTEEYSGQDWVSIPTTGMSAGQYIFKVMTEQGFTSHKILVQ